jgi:DNA-binding transcriptional ArsR family regulator
MELPVDPSQRLLACLSDASRFRIVRILGGTERCVTEIARMVGLSQSCTTRHLQALGCDRIVRRRRDGKRVLFRLDDRDATVSGLLAWLEAGEPSGRGAAPGPTAGGQEVGKADGGSPERPEARAMGDGSGGSKATEAGPLAGRRRSRRKAGAPDPEREPKGHEDEATRVDPALTESAETAETTGLARPPLARPGDLEDYLL